MENPPKIFSYDQEALEHILHMEQHLDTPEFNERIQEFCVEILSKDNKIDGGNFANVFVEESQYPGLCFKKLKPLTTPKNSVHEEGKILNQIKDGVVEGVRTPVPYASAEQYVKRDENRVNKRSLLVMERIDGVTLRDILEPEQGRKQELPEGFDLNLYFDKLKEFFTVLHDKYRIYHGDVNLGNLMIQYESLEPAVIDFGESVWGEDDGHEDVYGRLIIEGVNREDVDLKKVSEAEEKLRRYIDKKTL